MTTIITIIIMTMMRMTMIMTDDEYNNYDDKSLKHYP